MITILDYGAGNIRSVERAFLEIGIRTVVTSKPARVLNAERLVFPGVGAAPRAVEQMVKAGLDIALKEAFANGIPILGICLGAQVILESSEEGNQTCLGLIPGTARRFVLQESSLKVPHMGWNEVKVVKYHPLLEGIKAGDEFYFAHSYYPEPRERKFVNAVSEHGIDFCSALGCGSLFATQFHPEKSGRLGLRLLEQFAKWDGCLEFSQQQARGSTDA